MSSGSDPGTTASPVAAALSGRCPRCGKGKLFKGFLTVAPVCTECGLDLSKQDSGDGPAVFVILILGFIVVGLALWIELAYEPPFWLHLVLWLPLIVVLGIGMLRPLKAGLIGLQYKHRRDTYHDEDGPGAGGA